MHFLLDNSVFRTSRDPYTIILSLHTFKLFKAGSGGARGRWRGAIASWLVRSPPDRAVRVRALAGDVANLMLGVAPPDELASHPGGSRSTPSRFMPQKPELSGGLMGPRGQNADFTYLPYGVAVISRIIQILYKW